MALCAVVAKGKKSVGGGKKDKDKESAGSEGNAAKQVVEEFEAKMAAAHTERYESYRASRRAEGLTVDDTDEELAAAAAVAAGGEDGDGVEEEAHPLGPLHGGVTAAAAAAEQPVAGATEDRAADRDKEEEDVAPSPAAAAKVGANPDEDEEDEVNAKAGTLNPKPQTPNPKP